jgi:NhaA family Na+:H+ antiporter
LEVFVFVRSALDRLVEIFRHEAAPGLILITAAIAAMVVMNSGWAGGYQAFLDVPVTVSFGDLGLSKPALLWINDFLMAIFFLLVGCEIKRELVDGSLSSLRSAVLPIFAAVGGMVLPAVIYAAVNWGDPAALRGWAIPAATDIAFALGVLALLGSAVPVTLKVFLMAVAIIDDLGAIVIIAVFHTSGLSTEALAAAAALSAGLFAMNRMGIRALTPYMLLGLALWVAVLKSGVHATLAGVVVAFCLPVDGRRGDEHGPLHTVEHALVPWVAFCIMPLFAFANAGVSFAGVSPAAVLEPVSAGIAGGLFLGKQIGMMAAVALAVVLGIGALPAGVNWLQVWGVSLLAGIGFTMSLFIGNLALDPGDQAAVRIGVLSGSLMSGIAGYLILRMTARTASVPRALARA